MAPSSNVRKALQGYDGAKESSTVKPLTFHEVVMKLSELHDEKSKDLHLSDIEPGDSSQLAVRSAAVQDSPLEISKPARRVDTARKVVEPPSLASKASKNSTKNPKVGNARSPAVGGLASSAGSPKLNILSLKDSKLSSKAKNADVHKVLVSVNVCGSTGLLRFLVDGKDPAKRIVELALRAYAREGRLPRLGINCKLFDLYCPNSDFKALDPTQPVGSLGTRNFLLYKRRDEDVEDEDAKPDHAGSVPRKFMWNVMSTIVCSH